MENNEQLVTLANLIIGSEPITDRHADAMQWASDTFKKASIDGMDQAHAILSEYGNNKQVEFYMTEAAQLFGLAYAAAMVGMESLLKENINPSF